MCFLHFCLKMSFPDLKLEFDFHRIQTWQMSFQDFKQGCIFSNPDSWKFLSLISVLEMHLKNFKHEKVFPRFHFWKGFWETSILQMSFQYFQLVNKIVVPHFSHYLPLWHYFLLFFTFLSKSFSCCCCWFQIYNFIWILPVGNHFPWNISSSAFKKIFIAILAHKYIDIHVFFIDIFHLHELLFNCKR